MMIRIFKNFRELDYQIFTIPHERGWYGSFAKLLGNTCEVIAFNKISGLEPANKMKTKPLTSSFQGFRLLYRNS